MKGSKYAKEIEAVYGVITEQEGLTVRDITRKLDYSSSAVVSTAVEYLIRHDYVSRYGEKPNLQYRATGLNFSTPPASTLRVLSKTPTPQHVHLIEIPRSILKLLVQAHVDADTPLEGAFGKAMLCALKKLI